MKQPIEPSKEDCCNSGCNPCIFDVYEKRLKLYEKFLETGQYSKDHSENAMRQLEYTTFILVKVVNICQAHMQLFFKRPSNKDNKSVLWKPGDHFLVKYHNGETSCSRAYTPLKYNYEVKEYDFTVIVKVYEKGLVSKYLHELNIGDETLWRGPYGSYEIVPNKFKRIVMIAQGTGIAPFISIIESILSNEDDFTKISLFYCTKDHGTILLRDELYNYKDYWNFSYNIFLSKSEQDTKLKYKEPIVQHKLGSADVNLLKPFTSNDQVLLCGSVDFMKDLELLLISENDSCNIIMF